MNKIVSASAALILAVSLAACSSGESSAPAEPAPTVTVTAEPTATPQTEDEAFLSVIREQRPTLDGISDSQLLELAGASCDAFDAGASVEQVFDAILASSDNADTQEGMAFTVGAAVGIYCPEYTDLIDSAAS